MDKDAKDEFDLPDDADAGAADDSTADDDWAAAMAEQTRIRPADDPTLTTTGQRQWPSRPG
jgi:hypothetical protein